MTLRLPDHWVWDFWTASDGEETHIFFLHAPRSLGNHNLRHFSARIGHAVSRDLRSWTVLPEALGPGEAGAFDDRATWTGSVLRRGGRWLMFYTGLSVREAGPVQRIGLAVSDDLLAWRRTDVVIEADPCWYEKVSRDGGEEHWRDPWAFETPDGVVHLLVTAHAKGGPLDGRGVIGHAWSRNLVAWTVGPPLSEAGAFRQLEVPQLVDAGGRWWLLVSAGPGDHSAVRRAEPGFRAEGGTFALPADSPLGPFHADAARILVGDRRWTLRDGRPDPDHK